MAHDCQKASCNQRLNLLLEAHLMMETRFASQRKRLLERKDPATSHQTMNANRTRASE
jgi:hypothetical protein